ncbi:hypothetical protein [Paraburkholderia strydomiana]|uniref:hypothetical protein n=1 Tax=Paraburkholderia strydomiana TaxID=1245417 RepID=UPI001BE4EF2E|nr:hypothetical protein [Paraburkholderia strydomiana]MBT2794989.1 hypothetical protein [Paraburkholderia strydomiana]
MSVLAIWRRTDIFGEWSQFKQAAQMDSHTREPEAESPAITGTASSEVVRDFVRDAKKRLNDAIFAVLASRYQRVLFVGFARLNAPFVAVASVAASATLEHVFPSSLISVVLLAIAGFAVLSMFVRVRREKSLLMTSVYGRTLRVHLPRTQFRPRDAQWLASQLREVVRLARRARATTIAFDSPLLVSSRTSAFLASRLRQASVAEKTNLTFEAGHAREVGLLRQRAFGRYAQSYSQLRSVRLEVGANGRYLSRRMLVRFEQ